jgi:hypothetical protein
VHSGGAIKHKDI